MSEYKITLPDGATFEAPTAYECVAMVDSYQNQDEYVATLGEEEYTLDDLIEAYERKAYNKSDLKARAIYTDVAERLRELQAGSLTESP